MKTLNNFITASKLNRGTDKRTLDKYIKQFKINNDDLIADIYQYYGI